MSYEDYHDKRLKIKVIIILCPFMKMMINRNNTSCHLIRVNILLVQSLKCSLLD